MELIPFTMCFCTIEKYALNEEKKVYLKNRTTDEYVHI